MKSISSLSSCLAFMNAYEMATKGMPSQSCKTAAFTVIALEILLKSSLLVCVACRVLAAKTLTAMASPYALQLTPPHQTIPGDHDPSSQMHSL
mmetsp:Transcript_6976/g.16285  ORF Transcript_6976/g.16285 Transcript_6976/m.16285 type:complete len:93 (+) Transcript_6976:280-558(+)